MRRSRAPLSLALVVVVAACGRSLLMVGDGEGEVTTTVTGTSSSSSSMCLPDNMACAPSDSCCDSECVNGVCGGPRCLPGDAPLVLAQGLVWPLGLVSDDDDVYFVSYDEAGAVYRASKDGGPQEVVSEESWPHDIAFDEEYLYVTTESQVVKLRKDGSQRTVLANTAGGAGVALRGDAVVWAEYFGMSIRSVPRNGGSSSLLIPLPSSPFRLRVYHDRTYFTGVGLQLYELLDDGQAQLVMDYDVRNLAVDDNYLYVSVNQQSEHLAMRQPLGGGAVQPLFATNVYVEGVVVDKAALYLAANDAVYRMDKTDGLNGAVIYSEPMLAGTLAVDDSCLYVTVRAPGPGHGDGRVVRLPK